LPSPSPDTPFFQPNVLIDAKGCPRLSDFAYNSITKNIYSVNASTPHRDSTVRYYAPELLGAGGALWVEERTPTKKSDIYSLSMVIVEVRLFSESIIRPGLDCFCFQLATGRMPFPELTDPMVIIVTSKGERPLKPPHFDTPGMTPAIWEIAEKCWHRKAKKRPEANAVLKHLEKLADPGVCTHELEACSYLE
jgi:serine/threonine protein kinase